MEMEMGDLLGGSFAKSSAGIGFRKTALKGLYSKWYVPSK
jgi:hypothetical protein